MTRKLLHSRHRFALCSLLLITLCLAACSIGGGPSANVTPTVAPKPTPTFTPAPTTSSSLTMKTYTGMGFTIVYPSNWQMGASNQGSNGGGVTFSNPSAMAVFYIELLANPNGVIPPVSAVQNLKTALQSEGSKNVKTVPIASTTMVAGQSWDQAADTEDLTQAGQTVTLEQVMIASNHPASSPNTKLFIITYTAPAQAFAQTSALVFQPMLQSFKFTS